MRIDSLKIQGINYCKDFGNNLIDFDEQQYLNVCPLECETSIYDKEIITEETSKLFDAYIGNDITLKIETVKNMDNTLGFYLIR
jgi:hypothetical protein